MNHVKMLISHTLLGVGAAGVLATGADHLYEYAVDGFSTVPTIGTLFLLNFIGATIIGLAMLIPIARIAPRIADLTRDVLDLSGIGLAASSLIALWISETSSLFGFSDFGFRPTIVAAIIAESVAVVALGAHLALYHIGMTVHPSPLGSSADAVADVDGLRRVDDPDDLQFDARRQHVELP